MAEVQDRPRGGRRSKLTAEVVNVVCDRVAQGVPKKYAAQAAGIGESTLYEYLARDMEFAERMKKAEADAVMRNVEVVQVAAKTNWTAAAWWLERRYAKEFGRKDQLALSEGEAGEAAREAIEAIVGAIHSKVPDSCPSCQHVLKIKDDLSAHMVDLIKRFASQDGEAAAQAAAEAQEAPAAQDAPAPAQEPPAALPEQPAAEPPPGPGGGPQ